MAPIMVMPSGWTRQTRTFDELSRYIRSRVLKRNLECRYDTIRCLPGENLTEQAAFCIARGQSYNGSVIKTGADTNMDIGSSLGMPLYAHWRHLRIHFERYDCLKDALEWKEKASIEMRVGYNEACWRGCLGSMVPILPKGGYKKIDRMIKTGVIKFWPWYEAPLDLVIGPTDMFQVIFSYSKPFSPEFPMRIKVSLGPTLYRL